MILPEEKKALFGRINALLLRNYSLEMIHQIEGVSFTFIRANFKSNIQNSYVPIIGHKSEAYYTEEELLNPQQYCYETLSDSEKEIYHSLSGEC